MLCITSDKTEVSGSNPEWPTFLFHTSQRLPLPSSVFRRVPFSFFTGKTVTRLYFLVDVPGMTALRIVGFVADSFSTNRR